MSDLRCWVVTEGYQGNENQALGLAEAMGLTPEIRRIAPRGLWTHVPPRLWPDALRVLDTAADALTRPWPDLVISAGKRGAAPAAAVRRAARGSGQRCFAVHVLQPPIQARHFDLVVVPQHDSLRGDNIFVTRAAVHRVTEGKLRAAAKRFGPRVERLPRPRVAVLIGGSSKRSRLTPAIMRRLTRSLADLAADQGVGLLVTTSRRTGAANEAILREGLAGVPAEIWDGAGENPYFAYLGLADHIVVTADSVSMLSEACSTGKPVHVVKLDGASRRIDALHRNLRAAGVTRPFSGTLEHWTYTPLNDTAEAAAEIGRRLEEACRV